MKGVKSIILKKEMYYRYYMICMTTPYKHKNLYPRGYEVEYLCTLEWHYYSLSLSYVGLRIEKKIFSKK